ncbi:site-specific integrase, partial [Mycobacterium sp.]|uniref:site-specific integrase n=1 Tax=Mycobacterium sp. TaxID=1785 RepID=UPI003A8A667D
IENDIVTIDGKSNSSRQVYICKEIKDLAKKYYEETGRLEIWPNTYNARYKRAKILGVRCGVEINLHAFRETFATEWIYKGHSVVSLQQAMGHSSLAQMEPYIRKNQLALKRE